MSDTTTREERSSALDAFAAKTVPESTALANVTMAPPAEYIHGAQQVAVHRDERLVLQRIRELAAAAGQDWYFRFPVKSKGATEWIEGPTVQLALDVARIYGNVEVDCRAQDLGNVILYHARFHDVETGFSLTRPFQQRKGASRLGGADEGRRGDIDFQVGASKAIRNVIVNALRTYTNFAFDEAKEALVDKIGSQIERYRRTTVERIGKLVSLDRVEAVIGRKAGEWLAPDITRVIAMGKAIADGMANVDETFPPLFHTSPPLGHETAQHNPDTGEILDQFASSGRGPTAAEEAAAPAPPTPPSEPAAAATDPVKGEIIFKLLQLAAGPESALDKLESLELANGMYQGQYEDDPDMLDFANKACVMTAKVIKDELPLEDARKYLRGMAKT